MFEQPKRAFRRTIALLQTRQGAAVVWVSAATACRKNKTYEHWNPVWRLIKYQGTAWWLASHAVPMQWSYWNEGGSLCWSECSLTHYPMGRFRSVTDGGSKRHVAKWPNSWFRKSINLSSGWWWSWYPLGVSPPKNWYLYWADIPYIHLSHSMTRVFYAYILVYFSAEESSDQVDHCHSLIGLGSTAISKNMNWILMLTCLYNQYWFIIMCVV